MPCIDIAISALPAAEPALCSWTHTALVASSAAEPARRWIMDRTYTLSAAAMEPLTLFVAELSLFAAGPTLSACS